MKNEVGWKSILIPEKIIITKKRSDCPGVLRSYEKICGHIGTRMKKSIFLQG
jgi:hypothetical protein